MHGRYQDKAFLYAIVLYQLLYLIRNIDEFAVVLGIKP
jgi:hypothetical protein